MHPSAEGEQKWPREEHASDQPTSGIGDGTHTLVALHDHVVVELMGRLHPKVVAG
jgi:hypothetical protein